MVPEHFVPLELTEEFEITSRVDSYIGQRLYDSGRTHELQGDEATPFIYGGLVEYEGDKSETLMNVTWNLKAPLPSDLCEYFR